METTLSSLKELRLSGMLSTLNGLIETRQVHELSLLDGLALLVDSEKQSQQEKKYQRLIKNAKFRYQASIPELIYSASRNLNKSLVSNLSTCNYISRGESILITGATGCGKSFLASALGNQACKLGYRTQYYNITKLFSAARLANVNGTLPTFISRLSKVDLLIIDDFGLHSHIKGDDLHILLEIIEDRHTKKATILSSQLPVKNWFEILEEATIADAILDRLVHTSHRFELEGESMRKKK